MISTARSRPQMLSTPVGCRIYKLSCKVTPQTVAEYYLRLLCCVSVSSPLSSLACGRRGMHSRRSSAQCRARPRRQRLCPRLLRHAGHTRAPVPQGVAACVLHPVSCNLKFAFSALTLAGILSSRRPRIFKLVATMCLRLCAREGVLHGRVHLKLQQ